jgi:hypothetical protein
METRRHSKAKGRQVSLAGPFLIIEPIFSAKSRLLLARTTMSYRYFTRCQSCALW